MSWNAVTGITGVAALVVGIVLGFLQWIAPPGANQPESKAPPADERLELVDAEFDPTPKPVTVLEDVFPGHPFEVSPYPETSPAPGANTLQRLKLVLTQRNPSDDPAVLTGVKLVVHRTFRTPVCGDPMGGGVNPSLNYDFHFPEALSAEWSQVNPQNFTVAPRSVDALSITMGPRIGGDLGLVWRFSIYAVSKDGKEAHWVDGVATEYPPLDDEVYRSFIWAGPQPASDTDRVRRCAAEAAEELQEFVSDGDPPATVVHPGVDRLIAAYRRMATG
ncbi:hypothetical protein KBX71_18435 [Micromonospora sp. D93]|uniref:hypothetical protein n=1 Tax=Micromonospora sp. D93 TaxID=2824886 RepID=UPI001B392A2C|nr:hypothetical protein [Micromonospora sp. D93]MBQ1019826.1 hypothetical protein [Micromonospora sp. D93]